MFWRKTRRDSELKGSQLDSIGTSAYPVDFNLTVSSSLPAAATNDADFKRMDVGLKMYRILSLLHSSSRLGSKVEICSRTHQHGLHISRFSKNQQGTMVAQRRPSCVNSTKAYQYC